VNEASTIEDIWQRQATEAAIASIRKIIAGGNRPAMTLVGKLNDTQLGWIASAAIFGWIKVRTDQAIAENLDHEELVRAIAGVPQPHDIAAVHAILPVLAEQAAVDWSQPLAAWSKHTMTDFLLLAWKLIEQAALVSEQGKIIRPTKAEYDDTIPFDR
jgi:hypothetical protein